FFFQAEDGIRDRNVTGVQTCALPICTTRRNTPISEHPSMRAASSRESGMPWKKFRMITRLKALTVTGRISDHSESSSPSFETTRSEERRVGKEWRHAGTPGPHSKKTQ